MVSEKRAVARDRNLQCWNQRRRNCYSAGGAVDHNSLGMAMGISHHRWYWLRLAGLMAIVLSQAGRASARFRSRIGIHTKRFGGADRQSEMDQPDFVPAGLGVRECEVSDRSHLVPLPVLDPGFPATETCPGADPDRSSNHGDLRYRRSG